MAKRGVYKHLKRIHAPKSWMLSKVGGIWATKPSQGPHKLRECIPLSYLLRNKLRVALNGTEAKLIVKSKEGNISINGKVRTDPKFPVGIMDIVTINKTGTNYRVNFDVKGRWRLVKISKEEAKYPCIPPWADAKRGNLSSRCLRRRTVPCRPHCHGSVG